MHGTATEDPDYYAILGIEESASAEDIRRAFRAKAQEAHPDRHPGDAGAAARMQLLNDARGVLGDPSKRAVYDELRGVRPRDWPSDSVGSTGTPRPPGAYATAVPRPRRYRSPRTSSMAILAGVAVAIIWILTSAGSGTVGHEPPPPVSQVAGSAESTSAESSPGRSSDPLAMPSTTLPPRQPVIVLQGFAASRCESSIVDSPDYYAEVYDLAFEGEQFRLSFRATGDVDLVRPEASCLRGWSGHVFATSLELAADEPGHFEGVFTYTLPPPTVTAVSPITFQYGCAYGYSEVPLFNI